MAGVTTMEVTYARDSEFDGTAIHAGDYLLLVDNQLFGTEKNLDAAPGPAGPGGRPAGRGVHQHLLWRGRAGRGRLRAPRPSLRRPAPRRRSPPLEGGQPVYHYLISVE